MPLLLIDAHCGLDPVSIFVKAKFVQSWHPAQFQRCAGGKDLKRSNLLLHVCEKISSQVDMRSMCVCLSIEVKLKPVAVAATVALAEMQILIRR